MVPSAIDSPIWGITTSVAIISPVSLFRLAVRSVSGQLAYFRDELVRVWQIGFFERRAVGDRGVRTAEPVDRPVQPCEGVLRDPRRDLPRHRARDLLLGQDDHPAGLADGREDGFLIERLERPEVEDFEVDPVRFE